MSTMEERELFTNDYTVPAGELWTAVKRTVSTMDVRDTDEAAKTALFSTGVSLTSWGENMRAEVHERDTGSRLVVRGRPKGSFLTTKWGEDKHARQVQERFVADVDEALAAAA